MGTKVCIKSCSSFNLSGTKDEKESASFQSIFSSDRNDRRRSEMFNDNGGAEYTSQVSK